MSILLCWRCAHCGKQAEIRVSGEELKAAGESVYDQPLPTGWAWHKYNSIRFPARDSRTLGCCAEHAKLAAMKFEIPEWAEKET